ncbi:general substrate transporter [Aspergillus ibericus CBS 121593]|uniref:General substrate transporter n=1 Tax=Aspergillus ibericus CBS 121593 TaxID=1448316 RepID=A0A395GM83_9EURO|nr:general substrate transporter [Aspergillus ibericus CBS 121593]RAK96494.1 general substrate transporter [Aspergillus ibericus CBS 121593]
MANSKPYFGLKGGWLTFWVTVACATDMMLFGYDQGVFAGVIVTSDFLDVLDLRGKTTLLGTITAIYDAGCLVGAMAAIYFGDILGRKKTILCGTTIMTVGAILQASAYSVPQMIVGRIIAGIGNGMNTATAPVWQGETSQIKWRGKLVIIELVLNVGGYSLANWMTFAFSFVPGPAAWRFPLAFQIIFILILYATVPWLPESPRWLICRDQPEEAQQIIADLEGKDLNDSHVIAAYTEILATIQYEREHSVSWAQLLRGKTGGEQGTGSIRRLLLGAGAQAMQQLAGINVTSYYLPTVLMESVGLSERLARLLAACNSVSYLVASSVTIPTIERWGRRRILMVCALAQGICYLLITVLLRFSEQGGHTDQYVYGSAAVAFFFVYYVFFGLSFQGIGWLLPVELNSLSLRTKGVALGTATNWAMNFMVVEITPVGIQNLGWKFYIIWTVFNFAFVPTVYFFYPETANRSLEDIDRFFHEHHNVFVNGNAEATSIERPARYIELEKELVKRSAVIADAKTSGFLDGEAEHKEIV